MLEHGAATGALEGVTWRQADAHSLPFEAASFDVVACQFGVMFFPDKRAAFREALRVLAPQGTLLFNVWDRIEANTLPHLITESLALALPADPPRFLPRTPHGYCDQAVIEADLRAAGFGRLRGETVAKQSRAPSHRDPAIGFCQGTPLRSEIGDRSPLPSRPSCSRPRADRRNRGSPRYR
jgi:ubiquinone/menaquinone biosynthesis C-methylase UbiE